jgi:DNA-binding CsgD family transcriptional regulator
VERLSSHDLESLISRLRETIYAYCDIRDFKTRLVSALLGHDSPVMEERVSMVSHQRLDRFGLTRLEVEILHLVTQGKTNKEIAADLYISPPTVSKHAPGAHLPEVRGRKPHRGRCLRHEPPRAIW